jgi:hypothetical protein
MFYETIQARVDEFHAAEPFPGIGPTTKGWTEHLHNGNIARRPGDGSDDGSDDEETKKRPAPAKGAKPAEVKKAKKAVAKKAPPATNRCSRSKRGG